MRMKLISAVLVGVLAVVVAAGCGGTSKKASSTKTTTATTQTTTTSAGTTALTTTDCTNLRHLEATLVASFATGKLPANLNKLLGRLGTLSGAAPASLKADVQTLAAAGQTVESKLAKLGPHPTAQQLAAIFASLNAAKIQRAAADLGAWAKSVCKK
jgi:hypothetical protein